MVNTQNGRWKGLSDMPGRRFTCGNCGTVVASVHGLEFKHKSDEPYKQSNTGVYICSHCFYPVFFDLSGEQYPGKLIGEEVEYLSDDLKNIYSEIRSCYSVNAFTASVLLCRKMLMNISVEEGAKEGLTFVQYIDYLADNGLITEKNKSWVDQIRQSGNGATHSIKPKSEKEARIIIKFVEMILKTNYEYSSEIENLND